MVNEQSNHNAATASDVVVPSILQAPVDGALNWINASRSEPFALSELLDSQSAAQAAASGQIGDSYTLSLVLCDGYICDREQVRVTPVKDGFEFQRIEDAPRDIPPLLDPPAGVRTQWLDQVLAKHEFVVLLFYRGLW